MVQYLVAAADSDTVPLTPLAKADLGRWLKQAPKRVQTWIAGIKFTADPGSVALIAGADGRVERAVIGVGEEPLWDWAAAVGRLPARRFRLDAALDRRHADRAALGWALATYRFGRYRKSNVAFPTLVWPKSCDRAQVERTASASYLVRDLVNTPASDMGPEQLAAAARELARRHGARFRVVVGKELLKKNYPAIHAVGRASPNEPRLIDIRWGKKGAPKVTLVGKGVCFDTGGLDLKTAAGMKLMKKDMGGAAQALALGGMIMDAGLKVDLRILVPAVENSVSGNAMRPLDVVTTRQGLTVEIGNTDAEGRVILSDALADASSEKPNLMIDFATLTGAARVALGTSLPALFSNDDGLAADLVAAGNAEADPLWRLPLWKPYRRDIESKVADLTNSPEGGMAGAITAALFLEAFVGKGIPWAHIDFMAWNPSSRPGRPEGGEAQGLRAVYATIAKRFGR